MTFYALPITEGERQMMAELSGEARKAVLGPFPGQAPCCQVQRRIPRLHSPVSLPGQALCPRQDSGSQTVPVIHGMQ